MKLISIIALLLVFSSTAQQNWLQSYGSIQVDEILDITLSQNNDIVMAGYFTGNPTYGTSSLFSYGNSDILIIKTNNIGDVIWAKQAGGSGADRANSITTDASGNIYITGSFHNSATFGSITLIGQNKDVFVAKMDVNGNFLWAKSMGGSNEDIGYGIEVDNSGNVFCTGKYKGVANFNGTILTSTNNPITNLPSFDVFLTKLDGNGNILWIKDGKAKYDDRGLALTIDNAGNCYLTVEFSDTIYFDNTYINAAPNAGLVLKVDANGNEVWASFFRAGQALLNDIKWKNNNLYLTGDFRNNLAVEDINNTSNYSAIYDYYTFVCKFSDNGNLTWLSTNYSDNELFSNQLCLDNNDDIYTVGLFRCSYTEMNQFYGNSTFLSLGYRDVHYMKYNNAGQFLWSRQFGSNKDDFCSAITIKDIDFPICSGSFENVINVPKGNNFSNIVSIGTTINCGSNLAGEFVYKVSTGSKDIFLTNPFDINRLPYDFYSHSSNLCSTDTLEPCLAIGNTSCIDTFEICYDPLFPNIYVNLFQINSFISPLYNYSWNNGSSNYFNYIVATQTNTPQYINYYVDISREDGCASWTDSAVVIINPIPPNPEFTDVWNFNDHNSPPNPIDSCLVNDSLTIYVSSNDPNTINLNWLNGIPLNDSTIYAPNTDYYLATATNIYGCSSIDSISVSLNNFATTDTLDPYINIYYDITAPPFPPGDTVYMCENTELTFNLFDSSYVMPDGSLPGLQTIWTYDYGFPPDTVFHNTPELYYGQDIQPILNSGWHNISAHLINKCGDTIDYYMSRDFYVEIIPRPQLNLIGNTEDCLDSTVMVHAIYNTDTIIWYGNIVNNYTDSVEIELLNSINLAYAYIDTTAHGITCSNDFSLYINAVTQAEIYSSPINGVICAGDSALLSATNGDNWYWISPSGDTLGTNQTIYVNTPGQYNCLISYNSGCNLVSNFIEIVVFDNPELIVNPNAICNGDDAVIEVFSTANPTINWLPPLSGSNTTQTVNSGGVYYCELGSCSGTITDSVIVYESNPQVSLNFIGDTLICPYDSVFIQATSNLQTAIFNWNTTYNDSSFTTSNSGQYFVEISDTLGCTAKSDTILINLIDLPTSPIINDTTVCQGTNVLLQINNPDTVLWYSNNQLINTNSNYLINNIQSPQVFQISTSNGLCLSDTITVNVNLFANETLPNIIGNTVLCVGDDLLLTTNTPNTTYNWTTPTGTVSTNEIYIPKTNINNSGNYGLFILGANCNKDTNKINISINPNPDLGLSNDTIFCLDQIFSITSDFNIDYNIYYDTDYIHDSIIIYQIEDEIGCKNIDTLHIEYVDCSINPPNVFSPNNDNINDIYYFNIINGTILHIQIFNRWGNLIYESDENEWDGTTFKGKKVTDGTYFYIITYKYFYKDTTYDKQGSIQVFNKQK